MKKIFASVLFAVSAVLSLNASATVLDFEDLSGRPLFESMPANYQGISWAPNFWAYDRFQPPYTAHSGDVRIASNGSTFGNSSFSFSAPATFDGAWFAGNVDVSFSLYNSGSLVHTSAVLSLNATPTFLSSGYSGFVDQVMINGTNGQYVFDDLQFNSADEVSEPATLALFGFGLIGAAAMRRRSVTNKQV